MKRTYHEKQNCTRFRAWKWNLEDLYCLPPLKGRGRCFCSSCTFSLISWLNTLAWGSSRLAAAPSSPGFFFSLSSCWIPWWKTPALPTWHTHHSWRHEESTWVPVCAYSFLFVLVPLYPSPLSIHLPSYSAHLVDFGLQHPTQRLLLNQYVKLNACNDKSHILYLLVVLLLSLNYD